MRQMRRFQVANRRNSSSVPVSSTGKSVTEIEHVDKVSSAAGGRKLPSLFTKGGRFRRKSSLEGQREDDKSQPTNSEVESRDGSSKETSSKKIILPSTVSEANDIWSACQLGDGAFVRGVIQYAPEAVKVVKGGKTPLYFASVCGHVDIVKQLLSAGATDPDLPAYLAAVGPEIQSLLEPQMKLLKEKTDTAEQQSKVITSQSQEQIPADLSKDDKETDERDTKNNVLSKEEQQLWSEDDFLAQSENDLEVSTSDEGDLKAVSFISDRPKWTLMTKDQYTQARSADQKEQEEQDDSPTEDNEGALTDTPALIEGSDNEVTKGGSAEVEDDWLSGSESRYSYIPPKQHSMHHRRYHYAHTLARNDGLSHGVFSLVENRKDEDANMMEQMEHLMCLFCEAITGIRDV